MKILCAPILLITLMSLMAFAGCTQVTEPPADAKASREADRPSEEAGHHHDAPHDGGNAESLHSALASYEDALARIKEHRDTIRDAVGGDHPHQAHRALEELDSVMKHLPSVARDQNIPKSEWEAINTSAQRIRELFNKLHLQVDRGQVADFQAVAGEIQSEIEKLENVKTS